MTTLSISHEWQIWITENLQRGCRQDALLQIMVNNNVDCTDSQIAIDFLAQQIKQTTPTGEYIYQPSRIAEGNRLQVQDKTVRVVARIKQPSIVVVDDFLSAVECDELIGLAKQKLQPSTIVNPVTGDFNVIAERSSYGTYFALCENDFICRLDVRIAALMNCPLENGEGIQILNYLVGAEYKEHFDYFDPSQAGSQQQMVLGGNRIATLVMYLNDVEAGGETVFPKIGFSAVPKKGSAVYFEYCNSVGQLDALTLHAGAPVQAGEKWIATKWVRERRYG